MGKYPFYICVFVTCDFDPVNAKTPDKIGGFGGYIFFIAS